MILESNRKTTATIVLIYGFEATLTALCTVYCILRQLRGCRDHFCLVHELKPTGSYGISHITHGHKVVIAAEHKDFTFDHRDAGLPGVWSRAGSPRFWRTGKQFFRAFGNDRRQGSNFELTSPTHRGSDSEAFTTEHPAKPKQPGARVIARHATLICWRSSVLLVVAPHRRKGLLCRGFRRDGPGRLQRLFH